MVSWTQIYLQCRRLDCNRKDNCPLIRARCTVIIVWRLERSRNQDKNKTNFLTGECPLIVKNYTICRVSEAAFISYFMQQCADLPNGPHSVGTFFPEDEDGGNVVLLLLPFTGWCRTRRPIHCDHYWSIVLPFLHSNHCWFTQQSSLQ
jgi:hypothetical protein